MKYKPDFKSPRILGIYVFELLNLFPEFQSRSNRNFK